MIKQIVVKLVALAAFTVMAGCTSTPDAPSAGQARSSPAPEAPAAGQAPAGSASAASPAQQAQSTPGTAASDVLRFTREENGRRQSLELRKRDAGEFEATISIAGVCARAEAGPAKAVKPEGDGEVEVDPDGEGHPTDSFVLTARDKCRILIRLAAPERDYAWLRESDCTSACSLSNKALIRK